MAGLARLGAALSCEVKFVDIVCANCGKRANEKEWAWVHEIGYGTCPCCRIVIRRKENGKYEHQYLAWREWDGSKEFEFHTDNKSLQRTSARAACPGD